ncbi:ABC-2 type transport system ATP-binding protein [Pullulanibacillus pueri]|uniref:ABC transporter ATP-binding protein n=1 Tax=Pullulanibacillus pueri TaxID=1437324 RepID=A0A8J2ZZF7_9BACL|nr:ABC transporter ATP-binding protein [Pullulanibacillus pueri]MBM7683432.1 ABC-2 type transport system ATP-binding protein [Pullulanibacillus pueri]GGH87382.1 ABC transporter ATP-binding protein [Pullulanibacillus pueri]
MAEILQVEHLSGGYSNQKHVLHDLSFHVKKGELVGLVGLNGAGKSTTIKHILGLMEALTGTIKVDGLTIQEDKTAYRSKLAYIPETPNLYEQLTLREHLEMSAMAYGVDKAAFESRMPQLLSLFRMENRLDWFPGHFSKGMKQKVMIMCAFLVHPELYVVDEPFVGLDPIGIQAFLDLMIEMKQKGAGILMSTHILSTAEQYCDRFILLHEGKIAMQGTMDELRESVNDPQVSLHDIYVSVAKGEKPWEK